MLSRLCTHDTVKWWLVWRYLLSNPVSHFVHRRLQLLHVRFLVHLLLARVRKALLPRRLRDNRTQVALFFTDLRELEVWLRPQMLVQIANLQRLFPVDFLVFHRDHIVLQVAGQRARVFLDSDLHFEVFVLV